jgi:hypothetical protein
VILFGLIAVIALACGGMLCIFGFTHPPASLSWIEGLYFEPLSPWLPPRLQRFLLGLLIALGVPFFLFGVLSNNL